MPEQQLRKLLDQLHGELDHVDQLDESGRELLRTLAADIENRLDPDIDDETNPLLSNLQAATERFEASHPALTKLISDTLSALSNAGI